MAHRNHLLNDRDEDVIQSSDVTDVNDEQINRLVQYPPDNLDNIISAIYWFIFILFSLVIYLCWPLVLFVLIIYQLITMNKPPGRDTCESQLWCFISDSLSCNRDAQTEGRTAHPTEEEISFSKTIENLGSYSIEALLAHDITIDFDLNNIQQTDIITNNETTHNNAVEMIHLETENETTDDENGLTSPNEQPI